MRPGTKRLRQKGPCFLPPPKKAKWALRVWQRSGKYVRIEFKIELERTILKLVQLTGTKWKWPARCDYRHSPTCAHGNSLAVSYGDQKLFTSCHILFPKHNNACSHLSTFILAILSPWKVFFFPIYGTVTYFEVSNHWIHDWENTKIKKQCFPSSFQLQNVSLYTRQ